MGALPPGTDGVLGAPSLRRLPLLVDPKLGRVSFGAAALSAAQAPADAPAADAATTPPAAEAAADGSGKKSFRLKIDADGGEDDSDDADADGPYIVYYGWRMVESKY